MKRLCLFILSLLASTSSFLWAMEEVDFNSDTDSIHSPRESDNPLLAAAQDGNVQAVQELIAAGADVNTADAYYHLKGTPLMVAAQNGHIEVVRNLLAHGANLHAKDKAHTTVLMYALTKGHIEIGKLCIDAGIDVNAADIQGQTALHVVLRECEQEDLKFEAVKLLVEHGADVNWRDLGCIGIVFSRETKEFKVHVDPEIASVPLCLACSDELGSPDLVQLLLEHGADVNAVMGQGFTPLLFAYVQDTINFKTVSLLLDRGAEVNVQVNGCTPLMGACINGNVEHVEILIARGADINAVANDKTTTALMLALGQGHSVLAMYLIERGAHVDIIGPDGMTPLMVACAAGSLDVARLLIDRGADIDARDADGWTALMFASASGHLNIVQYLIDRGARVRIVSKRGVTPLMLAAECGHLDSVRFLLALRARLDINAASEEGLTALMLASACGKLDVVEFLIERGANVNAATQQLNTPLMRACKKNHFAIAQLLIDHGADINARNQDGFTPLMFAAKKGHIQVARILLASGAELNDESGCAALVQAGEDCKMSKLLIRSGADLTIENRLSRNCLTLQRAIEDSRALHQAIEQERIDTVRKVIARKGVHKSVYKCGLIVNCPNRAGLVPLSAAVRKGNIEICRLLLRAGANPRLKSRDGLTPFDHASAREEPEICDLLLCHMKPWTLQNACVRTLCCLSPEERAQAMGRTKLRQDQFRIITEKYPVLLEGIEVDGWEELSLLEPVQENDAQRVEELSQAGVGLSGHEAVDRQRPMQVERIQNSNNDRDPEPIIIELPGEPEPQLPRGIVAEQFVDAQSDALYEQDVHIQAEPLGVAPLALEHVHREPILQAPAPDDSYHSECSALPATLQPNGPNYLKWGVIGLAAAGVAKGGYELYKWATAHKPYQVVDLKTTINDLNKQVIKGKSSARCAKYKPGTLTSFFVVQLKAGAFAQLPQVQIAQLQVHIFSLENALSNKKWDEQEYQALRQLMIKCIKD